MMAAPPPMSHMAPGLGHGYMGAPPPGQAPGAAPPAAAQPPAPMALPRVGAEQLKKIQPVASPANARLFHQASAGTAMRVGGRFEAATASGSVRQLMAADGGVITVVPEPGDDLSIFSGFVEVIGTKSGDGAMRATAILSLGDKVDADLWNEAVQMMQLPQLRALFTPAVNSGA
mmetsp:Transcript_95472/g.165847  ORF Transcript_95472/g.165847 Transcript_95472/m.165847 type:complete len:174 (-) Transcript_95472:135-656(-)